MRPMQSSVVFATLGAVLAAQSNCSAGASPPTALATMNPFAGTSLYGHPNYPNLPGPTFPGFSFLIDTQQPADVEVTAIDIDLYDDGNLVQVNPTTTVTSPNQVGATAQVTVFFYPGPTWTGNETTPANWAPLATGTLTVANFHTDSVIVFNPPLLLPAGSWGIAIQVPQTTTGPNPGPLHPMVDPTTVLPGTYVDPALTLTNVVFQRESWTATLASPGHTQSIEFHFHATTGYANSTSFGTGCGVPAASSLALGARPVIGTTVDFVTAGIGAGAAFDFCMLGFVPDANGTSLAPFGFPGCTAWLQLASPIVATVSPVNAGSATLQLALPNDTSFAGVVLYAQSAALTTGASPLQTSPGLCVAIGLH